MNRPIGIIGAMSDEVNGLISRLDSHKTELVGGIEFHTGEIMGKCVVIAQCGVGKVFAAMCAEAMIIKYNPSLVVNTGVGGAISEHLACADTVVADKALQYDMDTSPIGDPIGLISGINRIYFDSDERATKIILDSARELSIPAKRGIIATGDKFVADAGLKREIAERFSASVCEMEGGAIAHVCFVNSTPFCIVRAISDGADGNSPLDFPTFLKIAVKNSEALTLALIEKY